MSAEDRHETTLRDLRIFKTICETGNLSKAGDRLGISQPSLSRTVRYLEEEFGLRLLVRNGRGVDPTEAGIVLRDHAIRILAASDELDRRMADLSKQLRGTA
ncbi:helix-turn-helix domain-containing protein [Aureimonas jatrophae]|uniref:LysR family transcriptional regulator n=1 Tax=Aureimonas jatrophae TaxID=1166073 RepID=UPI000B89FC09